MNPKNNLYRIHAFDVYEAYGVFDTEVPEFLQDEFDKLYSEMYESWSRGEIPPEITRFIHIFRNSERQRRVKLREGDFIPSYDSYFPLIRAGSRVLHRIDLLGGRTQQVSDRSEYMFWIPEVIPAIQSIEEKGLEEKLRNPMAPGRRYDIEHEVLEGKYAYTDPIEFGKVLVTEKFLELYEQEGWSGLEFLLLEE